MTPPATARLRSPLLVTLAALRLWHRKLIASVDHEAVIGRIVEESGWTPRHVFGTWCRLVSPCLGGIVALPAGGGGQRFRLAPAEAGVAAQQDRPGRDPQPKAMAG
jgi:hypothetical protein